MNSRQAQELDRHITGNYGEDQFRNNGGRDWYTRAMRQAMERLTCEWKTPRELYTSTKTLERLVRAGEAEKEFQKEIPSRWVYRLNGCGE